MVLASTGEVNKKKIFETIKRINLKADKINLIYNIGKNSIEMPC